MKKKLRYTDSSLYWKQRANRPGQKSVMWRNEFFNELFRQEQRKVLLDIFLENINDHLEILEYGCGIGTFCRILADIFPNAHITGIDFSEMIAVAQKNNSHPRITFFACEAENYTTTDVSYDLIVSSGCISSITNLDYVYATIQNIAQMLSSKGKILFIDPFHKYWPLARKSIYMKDLITEFDKKGIKLLLFSGISFWPIRLLIANSSFSKKTITFLFLSGEKILHIIGAKFWSDYKVLLFNRAQM